MLKSVELIPDEFIVTPPNVPVVPVMLKPERSVFAAIEFAVMFPCTANVPPINVSRPPASLNVPSDFI